MTSEFHVSNSIVVSYRHNPYSFDGPDFQRRTPSPIPAPLFHCVPSEPSATTSAPAPCGMGFEEDAATNSWSSSDNHLTQSDESFEGSLTSCPSAGSSTQQRRKPIASPASVFHQNLRGRVSYLPNDEIPIVRLATTPHPKASKLFVGQIRLEVTCVQLAGIFRELTGITPSTVVAHGPGCFFAYFLSHSDSVTARRLHNSVLFDTTGVWYAANPAEAGYLQEYTKAQRPAMKNVRLPRTAMVVRR